MIYEWHLHRHDWCHSHHLFGWHLHLLQQYVWAQANVQEVLWRLQANRLFAKPISASFMSPPVNTSDICCHQRPHHGAIQSPDYPGLAQTLEVKDIQSFLGFANFYWWFIYGYSEITVPLTHLTWKGTIYNFTDECRLAFEALKKAFTTMPVLTHWIPDTQITVETDASNYALAAVLSITTLDGELHPIAFHFLDLLGSGTQLWCARQKATGNFWSLQTMVALSRRLYTPTQHSHQSPALAILFHNQDPHVVSRIMVQIHLSF